MSHKTVRCQSKYQRCECCHVDQCWSVSCSCQNMLLYIALPFISGEHINLLHRSSNNELCKQPKHQWVQYQHPHQHQETETSRFWQKHMELPTCHWQLRPVLRSWPHHIFNTGIWSRWRHNERWPLRWFIVPIVVAVATQLSILSPQWKPLGSLLLAHQRVSTYST